MSTVISQSGQDIISQPQLSISVTVHIHQRVNCHQSIWTGHHQSTPAVNFSDRPLPSACQLSSVDLDRTSSVNPSCQFQWLSTSISVSTIISLDRTSSVNPSFQISFSGCPRPSACQLSSVDLDRTSLVCCQDGGVNLIFMSLAGSFIHQTLHSNTYDTRGFYYSRRT